MKLKLLERFKYSQLMNAYIFIAPFFILYAIFSLFPVIYSFFLSFHSWNGFGIMRYVGLWNFRQILNDPLFWTSLSNTVIIWLGNVFILVGLAFLMALVVNSNKLIFRPFFRGLFYVPQAIPVVATSLAFAFMFDKEFGILNTLLHSISLPEVPWLVNAAWAKVSLILTIIWRITPWHMLVILAGLQSIDECIYEAAEIDGASYLQRIGKITIPLLKPIFFYCILMATITSFQIFAEPYVVTGGGPGDATMTLSLYMYRSGFEYLKLGYASTISFFLLIITLFASSVQSFYFRGEL